MPWGLSYYLLGTISKDVHQSRFQGYLLFSLEGWTSLDDLGTCFHRLHSITLGPVSMDFIR